MLRAGTALIAVLLCCLPVSAQVGVGRGGGFAVPGPPPGIDVLGVEPVGLLEAVVNAPFSADTMTEITQQLADGNEIAVRTTGSIARDRRGRVRREQTLTGLGVPAPADAVRIVTITDPVAHELYRLDEIRRIAWRSRLPPPRERPVERPPQGLPQSLRTEQLPPMQFNGVKGEGTRTVLVLPAGTIGNRRPIEVVNERWFSPDLRIVLSTRRFDPRFGEVTFRLDNIRRADPPAELFEIPADFTVRDQPTFFPQP